MKSKINIKDNYIRFFTEKGHTQIKSASIIPDNDPTCLFNTAGMQPLVPYLLGDKHPFGKRLVDYQKCFRLTDLDEVGDKTHHTFFEMLGNWSLGDYFKRESITWSFEFLTKVLNIPVDRLAVTVFEGNDLIEADIESAKIWNELGIPESRISYLPAEDNWWPSLNQVGPCGSDTEIFYWSDNETKPPVKHDPTDDRWVEIWNNVFMKYNRTEDGEFKELSQKNVDTGMGVERITAALSGVDDNYMTEIWMPIIEGIERISNKKYEGNEKAMRIVADHIRAIVMLASDEKQIEPSNTDQGYVLRRIIRRLIRYAKKLDIDIEKDFQNELIDIVVDQFKDYYEEVYKNKDRVKNVVKKEKDKFAKTLEKGLKELNKVLDKVTDGYLDRDIAFRLYDTFGFPIELTAELVGEKGIKVDFADFNHKFKEHQEKSRKGAEQKFKGGLSESGVETARLHTATHLLHAALKKVLGNNIVQRGSNITPDRLRFDFNFDRKMTGEEIEEVETLVNEAIKSNVEVICEEKSLEDAYKEGAVGLFKDKYDEVVKVFTIGEYSKEICGGPHAKCTGELGEFKIIKEQSASAGVRRIKAVLK